MSITGIILQEEVNINILNLCLFSGLFTSLHSRATTVFHARSHSLPGEVSSDMEN